MLRHHLQSQSLQVALGAISPFVRSWSGTVFRAVSPRYATFKAAVSGHGSFLTGGRFNGKGCFEAVYAG